MPLRNPGYTVTNGMIKRCSACSADNRYDARFCHSCGTAFAADAAAMPAPATTTATGATTYEASCDECGFENPPGVRYCVSCGTKLRAVDITERRSRPGLFSGDAVERPGLSMPVDSSNDSSPFHDPGLGEPVTKAAVQDANEPPPTADPRDRPYIAVGEAGFGDRGQQGSNRAWFLAGMGAAALVVLGIALWLFAGLTRPSGSAGPSRPAAAIATIESPAPLAEASTARAGSAAQPRADALVVITMASSPSAEAAAIAESASLPASSFGPASALSPATPSTPEPASAPEPERLAEPAPKTLEAQTPSATPGPPTTQASSTKDSISAASSASTSASAVAAEAAAAGAQAKATERRRLAAERRREKAKRDNAEREAKALALARTREVRQEREQAALAAQAEKDAASRRALEAQRLRQAAAAQAAARAAAVPATPTVRGVREICAGGGSIARSFCQSRECGDPAHAREAICKQVREAEERRRNPID